jgi:FkbM family methyltransferase
LAQDISPQSWKLFMVNPEILRHFQSNQSLYEEMVARLIRKAPVSGTFVDCGAHIGVHTRSMLARREAECVIAIEALPHLANLLNEIAEKDHRLVVYQCAVGDHAGSVDFHVASNAEGYSGIRQRDISDVSDWTSITIEINTLDSLLGNTPRPAVGLMKLDLEGGEFDALVGAMGVLKTDRPILVFENGLKKSTKYYDYDKDDFFSYFREAGYQLYDFFGNLVDEDYWEVPLFTYMFVGVPLKTTLSSWYRERNLAIVRELIAQSKLS